MGQGQEQRQVPGVAVRSLLEIGRGRRIFPEPIVRHSHQDGEPVRLVGNVRLGFEQRGELPQGVFVLACLEVRQAQVEAQAGNGGIERHGLQVKLNRLGVMLLASLEQAEMGQRLGIAGLRGRERPPGIFGGGCVALMLE